jgi:hypothetical protein
MTWEYPATYTDKHGSEAIVISNDGKLLQFCLRGVEFSGWMFDDFEPQESATSDLTRQFTFASGALCACTIECQIPISVVVQRDTLAAQLHVRLVLGEPASNGGIDTEELELCLDLLNKSYRSDSKSGWLEHELLNLQKHLPEGMYIKACINCAYSDYSPYGNGLFGCMMCFRGCKSDYSRVKGKQAFFAIMNRATEQVQETYLCPEFEKRLPGTGYRG